MPSSPYPSRTKGDEESRDRDPVEARKRSVLFEESGGDVVQEDVKPTVDLGDDEEDCKPAGKVRRAPLRSSTRIATLASRAPVKQEAPGQSPSPPRGRKKVKVTVTETKVTKKVKTVKVKKEEKKELKKEDASVKAESDGDPLSGDTDDLGEVAEEIQRAGTDQLGQKLAQQLVDRANMSDAMQVKATIRIFNFMYLEAIQVCLILSFYLH